MPSTQFKIIELSLPNAKLFALPGSCTIFLQPKRISFQLNALGPTFLQLLDFFLELTFFYVLKIIAVHNLNRLIIQPKSLCSQECFAFRKPIQLRGNQIQLFDSLLELSFFQILKVVDYCLGRLFIRQKPLQPEMFCISGTVVTLRQTNQAVKMEAERSRTDLYRRK